MPRMHTAQRVQAEDAKQAQQCQAAAETAKQAEISFAEASGLAAVFGALNLNEDKRVQCLARTVQWFQELGVRPHGSRCCTARR
jgi:23S rRNA maturation mini-RNase III